MGQELITFEVIPTNTSNALSPKESDLLNSFMKEYYEDGNLEALDAKLALLNYTIMPYGNSIAVVADESTMASSAEASLYCGMES